MGDTPIYDEMYELGNPAETMHALYEVESELASLRAEKEEFKRIGQGFERDFRKHFEQACINLQRAERAEAERDAAVKDAERYRHIESRVAAVDLGWMFTLTQIPTTTFGEAIDAAIAARKGEQ